MQAKDEVNLEQMLVEVCEVLWPDVYDDKKGYALPTVTLDLLHECWLKLTPHQRGLFVRELAREVNPAQNNEYQSYIYWGMLELMEDATAPQRLLALWRTIKGL